MNTSKFPPQWTEIFTKFAIPTSPETKHNPPGARRILVACRGGNVRSVAVAFLLKYKYSCDALAASFEKNDALTLALLMEWAETVIVTEGEHVRLVKEAYRDKVQLVDIGPDRWANPFDHELLATADSALHSIIHSDNDKLTSSALHRRATPGSPLPLPVCAGRR
jgi:hypothetical protein